MIPSKAGPSKIRVQFLATQKELMPRVFPPIGRPCYYRAAKDEKTCDFVGSGRGRLTGREIPAALWATKRSREVPLLARRTVRLISAWKLVIDVNCKNALWKGNTKQKHGGKRPARFVGHSGSYYRRRLLAGRALSILPGGEAILKTVNTSWWKYGGRKERLRRLFGHLGGQSVEFAFSPMVRFCINKEAVDGDCGRLNLWSVKNGKERRDSSILRHSGSVAIFSGWFRLVLTGRQANWR